jgi:DNA-binding FadR family transcriptional regulator
MSGAGRLALINKSYDMIYSMQAQERLHTRVTRILARQVMLNDSADKPLAFPREADLSRQLGVSRTVLRESMKVLVDKGMVEMKPRAGTRARPSSQWRLLDPDVLAWQAELRATPDFLRNLCEVRLAIEPTAAGFAAVRATDEEISRLASCVERRARPGMKVEELTDLDLEFHSALVDAGHNSLLSQLSAIIRTPIRIALAAASRFASTAELGLEAHQELLNCLRRRDPIAARRAADEVVGLAMLAVEKVIHSQSRPSRNSRR